MKTRYVLTLILYVLACFTCFALPPKPVNHYAGDGGIRVPYQEMGGVKTIHVHLNNMGVDMIFDTGCSTTLMSVAEFRYMAERGLIYEEDVLGESSATIADGSTVPVLIVLLREVKITDKLIFRNVVAQVSPNVEAPLLLGNEVLNQVKSYKIDNLNRQIVFYL